MRFINSIIPVCILICASLPAQAQKDSLIILPFSGGDKKAEYNHLQDGLPEMLTACFVPYSAQVNILERTSLQGIMDEQGIRFDQVMDEQSLSALSKLTQADFILKGSYFVNGDTIRIQAHLYDTETTILAGSATSSQNLDDLNQACMDIAEQTSKQVAQHASLPQLHVDETPQLNQHFITGLGYFYGGACHKAMPEFLKVLKLDNEHYDARYWLAQCYLDMGLENSAVLEFKKLAVDTSNLRHQDVVAQLAILTK